jgi:hypothetical protein
VVLRLATKISIFDFSPVEATRFLSLTRYVLAVVILGVVYFILRKNKGSKNSADYPLEFSCIILCFLIIPAISWLHYFSLSVLSLVLIISFCWNYCPHQLKLVVPLSAISCAMIAFRIDYAFLTTSFGQGFFTRTVVSLPFLGACALLLINLLLMRRERNPF